MSEISDSALLHDYVTARDEEAFAELVRRHLPLVYSAAARRLGNDLAATEDVAQAAFVQLASKARELTKHPVLAGWLYVTASRIAASHSRHLERRQRRETLIMNADDRTATSSDSTWPELKPFLDDAMQELADDDRHAVVLRYDFGRGARTAAATHAGVQQPPERCVALHRGRGTQAGARTGLSLTVSNA